MIFILPLSHEETIVKRLPVLTFLLIIVNTVIFGFISMPSGESKDRLVDKTIVLIEYYYAHPYLDIPVGTKSKLFSTQPSLLEEIENLQVEVPLNYKRDFEQEKINRIVYEYEDAFANEHYRKFGFIPAEKHTLTIISSMFLHSDFFHLLFNMIFLFLSGYILEDYWGRGLYLLFYMTSGIVATLTHGMMLPHSYVPLVGASGAVAGLMGAFLVRFFKTKIYFFYFILFFIKVWTGRFLAPAYIMLSLWFGQQVLFAMLDDGAGGGVAFWAHIGGFVFGIGIAFLVKVFKIEETVISGAIERKVTMFDASTENAVHTMKSLAENTEDSGFVRMERARHYIETGERRKAVFEAKRALVKMLKEGETADVMNYYTEISDAFTTFSLKEDYQHRIVDLFEHHKRLREAATACKNLAYASKKMGDDEAIEKAVRRYKAIINTLKRTEADSQAIHHKASVPGSNTPRINHKEKNRVIPVEALATQSRLLVKEPRFVNRVTAHSDMGLHFEGASKAPVLFGEIRFIWVFRLDGETHFFMDCFVKDQVRPYRISSGRIAYSDFFETPQTNMLLNFRSFTEMVLSRPSTIYTNKDTQDFVSGKAARLFGSLKYVEDYESKIWDRISQGMNNVV